MQSDKIVNTIIRKRDLNKGELDVYNSLVYGGGKGIIRLWDTQKKKDNLKPVLAFMLNTFFNQSYYSPQKFLESKEYTELIKWYFDNDLVPTNLQKVIIKRPGRYKLENIKYHYLKLNKETKKLAINIDSYGLIIYAYKTANVELMVKSIKRKPYHIHKIIQMYQHEKQRSVKPKITKKLLLKLRRVSLLPVTGYGGKQPIPEKYNLFTPTFCVRYVQIAGSNLEAIPPKYRTEQVCLNAVAKAGTALEFVPHMLKTESLCAIALNNSPTSLKYIPAKQQKSKLILKALLKNKNARKYIKAGAAGYTAK